MKVRGAAGKAQAAVWGPLSSRVRASGLRTPAIYTYRTVAGRLLVGPPPRVFANSIPKAGTHLLTQLLSRTPRLWFTGTHVIDRQFRADRDAPGDGLGAVDTATFDRLVKGVRNGQYVTAHVGALPGVADVLDRYGFCKVLMIRDPRDIAVSMAFYYARSTRLHTYARFGQDLTDMDSRLLAVIQGVPATEEHEAIPSLGERVGKYAGWLDDPSTVTVRFEDLVGESGGGTRDAQHAAVRRLMLALQRPADADSVATLARSTFAPHAATFRRGAIGEWREHFTAAHHDAWAEHLGDVVTRFGYEPS